MPPANGSTADTDTTQLWRVKHSGDTTEIDLCGSVISSSDQSFLKAMGAGERAFDHVSVGSAGQLTKTLVHACHLLPARAAQPAHTQWRARVWGWVCSSHLSAIHHPALDICQADCHP
jgi:hypothetical protein